MKYFLLTALLFCFLLPRIICAQTSSVDRVQFFNDTSVLDATIITNTTKLFKNNRNGVEQPARFLVKLDDGTQADEPVQLSFRGHFRHGYCYVPPLKINFKNKKNSMLSSLKSLKLVSQCKTLNMYDQYLLKEFIIYKIYNLLSPYSFHARLLTVHLQDSAGNKKTVTVHSFLLEDLKDLAKRNHCKVSDDIVNTEKTDRQQMTLMALFEYMIGNTDWAVSVNHNIRLLASDSLQRPIAVAYDFDYSGLVNTEYAVPDEKLGTENVRQRVYRGFARTPEEINETLEIFKQQKQNIYALINNFNLLNAASKKEMTNYLEDFYDLIKSPGDVKYTFIQNARKE
jgi:hypothetical protein